MKSLLSIGILLLCLPGWSQSRSLRSEPYQSLHLDQRWIIVKYEPDAATAPGVAVRSDNAVNTRPSVLDGMMRIPIRDGQDPIEVCNQFLRNPDVIYAEPIIRDYLLEVPSDPLVGDQYYLDKIRAYDAWDITKGDDDIAVAIIDSGVDIDHEDLIDNLWINSEDPIDGIDNDGNGYVDDYFGYDFSDDDNDPNSDRDAHGAIVAGIVGATVDNGLGIAGIGYNTKIAALKGFSSVTNLSFGLFDAILYAADNGIEVMNLSWGSIREPLQSEQDIINYAVLEKNVVIVAAAGNDGTKTTAEEKFYPASYNHVLSVGGSTSDDTKWSGSSYNHAVDLIAPAAGILSTGNGSTYSSSAGFGTSFAAPMVAATAALVIDQFPELSALQVMERVRVTTDDIYDVGTNSQFEGKLGSGRLNAFNALTESNVKSLRAESISVTKPNQDQVFYGDTLTVSFEFTNYLGGLSDPEIYFSSPDDEFFTTTDLYYPGGIGTLSRLPYSMEIILSEDLPPESLVDLRMDFHDGTYTDFQFIDIKTAPDYADFGNANLQLSIAGDGSLGFIENSSMIQDGLVYQEDFIMNHSGIMIATDENTVSDNIISNFDSVTKEVDFTTSQYYKIGHHPFADRYGHSTFQDEHRDLLIEQSNITSTSGEFIINRYRLVNTGADTLEQLSFGVFTDWNLINSTTNYAAFDPDNAYLYTRSSDATLFAGTKLIGAGELGYSAIDIANFNGNTADASAQFTDPEKYQFITSDSLAEAGGNGSGNDVAGLIGLTVDQLNPGDFEYINLLFAVGASKSSLTSNFQAAETYLEAFQQSPRVLETIISCDNGSALIDPEGDVFIFYLDPTGTMPLDTASTFAPSSITSDTTFYVRSLDAGYPSEIAEVRIRLFDDIADFSIVQDTLYLDHPTTNIASFVDQSIDAIAWSWDFGQGTQSSIQNPSILFNEPGSYDVTLTVENQQGCIDEVTKTLVVVERPSELLFEEIVTCPNETITLSHNMASALYLFSSQFQTVPVNSGETIAIGPFERDTTLYVAGRVDGLLTERTPLSIDILEVNAQIRVYPDTLSTDFQLVAFADIDPTSSVNWIVNGLPSGSDSEIRIPANVGNTQFELQVTSANGCSVTEISNFEISTSVTPVVSNITSCTGSTAILEPLNGTYFGFYEDPSLDQLIAKGTQLHLTENQKLYVVNLDDGLPGNAVEVDVAFEEFNAEINFKITKVDLLNRIDLSVSSSLSIESYQWYVDGEKSEISPEPVFFFEDRQVTIALEATSTLGCLSSDTVQLNLIPPEEPLGLNGEMRYHIYPNPTDGLVSLAGPQSIDQLVLKDLAGKEISFTINKAGQMDLTHLPSGIYVLEMLTSEGPMQLRIIKQ